MLSNVPGSLPHFGPWTNSWDGVSVSCTKSRSGRLLVMASDSEKALPFPNVSIPADQKTVHLRVAWDKGTVSLFANGALERILQLPPVP